MGAIKDREYGRIVDVSSVSGKRPVPDRAPYTSSKAGMLELTRTLAAERGPNGVTANAMCPGSVRGPRIGAAIENHAAATDRSPEELRREKVDDTSGESFVESTDAASLVAYRCSDAASSLTGQVINISEKKLIHQPSAGTTGA